MCAMWLPSGPIENGTTYIVRPRMHPSKSPSQRRAHLRRRDPVVRRARVVLALAADERAVLDARDVGGVGQREIAVGPQLRVELAQRARRDHLRAQPVVFGLAAVAPDDAIGCRSAPRPRAPTRAAANGARATARRRMEMGSEWFMRGSVPRCDAGMPPRRRRPRRRRIAKSYTAIRARGNPRDRTREIGRVALPNRLPSPLRATRRRTRGGTGTERAHPAAADTPRQRARETSSMNAC